MDIDNLVYALENETNEQIIDKSFSSIKSQMNDVLQQLGLSRELLRETLKKLKNYKYCESLKEVEYGRYIRWINLKSDELKLTAGGIICKIELLKCEHLFITVKNNLNRLFKINFNECLIFQKLTDQEIIILKVFKYLEKD